MGRWVNCLIAISHCNILGLRPIDDETILSVIRMWLAPLSVNSSNYICQACWDLAQSPQVDDQRRQLGHCNVCLCWGRSLASQVSHTNSARELRIYDVIQEWVIPRTIQAASPICHACWVAADRAAVHMVSGPSTSSQPEILQELKLQAQNLLTHQKPTIVLPEYMRATETEQRCFIEGCHRIERYRVPLSTRKMLLHQYKYYIPENALISCALYGTSAGQGTKNILFHLHNF